ncbi:hypothetical protein SDC9_181768 [bioreactor metagenome]|uniref:Uncharacterized protein n=1 Tax=bioreactor metagenome TaxID=1076179 RepID=A0A645H5J8_9ZZZZ
MISKNIDAGPTFEIAVKHLNRYFLWRGTDSFGDDTVITAHEQNRLAFDCRV